MLTACYVKIRVGDAHFHDKKSVTNKTTAAHSTQRTSKWVVFPTRSCENQNEGHKHTKYGENTQGEKGCRRRVEQSVNIKLDT